MIQLLLLLFIILKIILYQRVAGEFPRDLNKDAKIDAVSRSIGILAHNDNHCAGHGKFSLIHEYKFFEFLEFLLRLELTLLDSLTNFYKYFYKHYVFLQDLGRKIHPFSKDTYIFYRDKPIY